MTDLVIGAGGFVGPHLVRLLRARGRTVVGVDLHPGPWVDDTCDICDRVSVDRLLTRHRPRRLFHLAAQSSPREAWDCPEITFLVNCEGALHVLLACRAKAPGCRVLFVSTSTVYGDVPPEAIPLVEDRQLYPPGPYEASKALTEHLCDLVSEDELIETIVVRAFNHAGPGQGTRFVVPSFARQVAEVALERAEPVIRTGNLEPHRDFTDVRDVVRVYAELMDRGDSGGIYNVCSGSVRSVRSILEDLIRLAGIEVEIRPHDDLVRTHDLSVLTGDVTRLRRTLGWVPEPMGDATLRDVLEGTMAELLR